MTSATMTSVTISMKTSKREEPEWIVFVVVAVALLLGWLLKMSVENSTAAFSGEGVSLAYPAGWVDTPGAKAENILLQVADVRSGSVFPTSLAVQVTDSPQAPAGSADKLGPTVTSWTLRRSQELDSYQALSTELLQVAGQPAARIDYSYVSDPIASPYSRALPVVVEGVDYLILHQDKVYVVTTAADANRFDQAAGQFEDILGSLKFN